MCVYACGSFGDAGTPLRGLKVGNSLSTRGPRRSGLSLPVKDSTRRESPVPAGQPASGVGVEHPRCGRGTREELGSPKVEPERQPPPRPPPGPRAPPTQVTRRVLGAPDPGRREGRGALPGRELSQNLTPGEAAGPWPGLPILLKWKQFLPGNLPEFSVESHLGFASWRISPRPHLPL